MNAERPRPVTGGEVELQVYDTVMAERTLPPREKRSSCRRNDFNDMSKSSYHRILKRQKLKFVKCAEVSTRGCECRSENGL